MLKLHYTTRDGAKGTVFVRFVHATIGEGKHERRICRTELLDGPWYEDALVLASGLAIRRPKTSDPKSLGRFVSLSRALMDFEGRNPEISPGQRDLMLSQYEIWLENERLKGIHSVVKESIAKFDEEERRRARLTDEERRRTHTTRGSMPKPGCLRGCVSVNTVTEAEDQVNLPGLKAELDQLVRMLAEGGWKEAYPKPVSATFIGGMRKG
jgi:hypothetical protein